MESVRLSVRIESEGWRVTDGKCEGWRVRVESVRMESMRVENEDGV